MPPEVLLTLVVVLGLVLGAMAVTGVLAWLLVLVFRAREGRRPPAEGREQSTAVANGVFALDSDGGLLEDDTGQGERAG
ncbi:hypothetical protein [Blastococcus sp. Marseille-P5729]|uniref:hypothetical protein n=1 Tax=Blastococcus sp. Marseille-P5729 TaxID=2086582 RepID=UPI000D0FC768|nr:hypothetical protein [Blastococcus sp. Marseille-P5729]